MGEATGLISLSASSFENVDVYTPTLVRAHTVFVHNCKLLLAGTSCWYFT